MVKMNEVWQSQQEFDNFVLGNDVIKFSKDPIPLAHARESHLYIDWRTPSSDAFLLDKLSYYVVQYSREIGLSPDSFHGVPEGVTKLGIAAQLEWAKNQGNYAPGKYSLSMGRGSYKQHGLPKDQSFLGLPRGRTIVLEDVVTTGNSLLSQITILRENNVEIIAAIALTDRNQTREDGLDVRHAVHSRGIDYYSMSNVRDLLPEAIKLKNPSKSIVRKIEREYSFLR